MNNVLAERAFELNETGLAHWRLEQTREALAAFAAASLAAYESGCEPSMAASIDGNLSTAANAVNDYGTAAEALERILGFREVAFAGTPLELIGTLFELSDTLYKAGDGRGALVHARRAWRIVSSSRIEDRRVRDYPVGSRAVATLGLALAVAGKARLALRVLGRARRDFDCLDEHDGTVLHDVLDCLTRLHAQFGDTDSSAAAARALVDLAAEKFGPYHKSTLAALNLCGSRYYDDKQYDRAVECFQQAFAISPMAAASAEDRITIGANLAKTLLEQDRLSEAGKVLDSALALIVSDRLENNRKASGYFIARTQWHRRQRHYTDARQTIDRAIAIVESHCGCNSHELAPSLNFLAGLALDEGQFPVAEAAYTRITGLDRISNLSLGTALSNLGNVLLSLRKLPEAKEAAARSLEVLTPYGADHVRLAAPLNNLGAIELECGNRSAAVPLLERALQLEERVYGVAAAKSAATLSNLASALAAQGRLDDAQRHLASVLATQFVRLEDLVAINDDSRRIDILGDMRHELDAYVGISSVILAGAPERAREVYVEVARRKGFVTAALTDEVRRRRVVVTPSDSPQKTLGYEAGIPSLPDGCVLLDFVAFGTATLTLGPDPCVPLPSSLRYGLFVVRSLHLVSFHDLGPAEIIDRAVAAAWNFLRTDAKLAETREATRILRRLIWDPLKLDEHTLDHVVISPDGALNDVSFAALARDDSISWLGDDFVFSYVNSARDLSEVRSSHATMSGPDLVLADPAYAQAPESAAIFLPLPGTRAEGAAVAAHLGCSMVAFHQATFEALAAASSPRILHVAAHGFYWSYLKSPPDHLPPRVRELMSDPDPLGRAGLALAPAYSADGSGRMVHDGIVTARALLNLDLSQTELAVLSACDTGLGHPELLDGAHGLRRALRASGARMVVVSLWKVNDETAPELIERFYSHLATSPPHQALALASREVCQTSRTKHPSHWAAFIVLGNPGHPIKAHSIKS